MSGGNKHEKNDRIACRIPGNRKKLVAIENQSLEQYYEVMEEDLKNGDSIISDYPFSVKQKDKIKNLAEKYEYQVVTFRLIGDLEVLFKR